MNYSVTQASNVGVIAGLIVLILNKFHVSVVQDEVEQLIGACIIIFSTVTSWQNRQSKGDLTVSGFRK